MTKQSPIALVITDRETNAQISALSGSASGKKLSVGLLELRADLFKSQDPAYIVAQIKQRKALKIPLLLTVRNQKKEGAVKVISDDLKLKIIMAALPLVNWVDIEVSSPLLRQVVGHAHQIKKKVIISSHHLQSTPHDLDSIFKKSLSLKADIVKIAGYAKTMDDVMNMVKFTWAHRKHKLITMSLGKAGSISRLILPAVGSLYTYTFLHKPTAAGQINATTLKSHLKTYFNS